MVIEQDYIKPISAVVLCSGTKQQLVLHQVNDTLELDTTGAKQLIKVLQEFVENE